MELCYSASKHILYKNANVISSNIAIADDPEFQVNAVVIYGVHHRGRNISRSVADRVSF
jgi:hypothetical protein